MTSLASRNQDLLERLNVSAATWILCAEAEAAAVECGMRVPDGLCYRDFRDAYTIVVASNLAGLIMDLRVDISWATIGIVGEDQVASAQATILADIRQWFVRRGPFAIIAVYEVGRRYGLHSHLTIAASPHARDGFKLFLQSALRRVANSELVDTAETKTLLLQDRERGTATQWNRFRYIIKSMSPYASLPRGMDVDFLVPLHCFAELDYKSGGSVSLRRMTCITSALDPWQRTASEIKIGVDGPQLYNSSHLDFHYASLGKPRFRGELAARKANYLKMTA